MSGIFTKMRSLPVHYPLIRGMISYSIIWPTCSLVQEYLDHGATIEEANFARAARFGIFGSLFMAPVFYGWMKFSGRFFKSKTLKSAILRATIEQVSYSPLAMVYFFFGMSLLELKPLNVCWNEVKEKFWPTYKIGVIFWPTAQTFNFYCVSEKNRVVFVSIASLIWTTYLAHMKAKEQKHVILDQDVNVLKMTETVANQLANTKVVVESDTLVNKKDQPLEGASDNPNDSNKSNLNKKPEASLGVAPKDQVVSDSDSTNRNISNPVILKQDLAPSIPDKILPATAIAGTNANKMPRNTIIIEPTAPVLNVTAEPTAPVLNVTVEQTAPVLNVTVSHDTPVPVPEYKSEKNSLNIKDEPTLTIENRNNSNQITTDLYEQSIDTGLSEHTVDNLSTALLNVGIDTNIITPKVDAAFFAKRPGPGDEDSSKTDGFPAEFGKDPAVIESSPNDVTNILNENSLAELPIADEEILKTIS